VAYNDASRGLGGREFGDFASPDASFTHSFAILLSDTEDMPNYARVIFIGCPGFLHYKMLSGEVRTRKLPAGYHPLQITRVFVTGTTIPADELEGHY